VRAIHLVIVASSWVCGPVSGLLGGESRAPAEGVLRRMGMEKGELGLEKESLVVNGGWDGVTAENRDQSASQSTMSRFGPADLLFA
jgi:hypothetical protein